MPQAGLGSVSIEPGGRGEGSGGIRRDEDAGFGGDAQLGEAVVVGVASRGAAHAGPGGGEAGLVGCG